MTEPAASRSSASLVRRILVGVIIGSFGLAAVLGIIVLLGVELGEVAFKVLTTTALVGAFSVAVLCCAALLGRRGQLIGVIGVVVAILTCALALWVVWVRPETTSDALFRLLWSGVAITAAFSLASLLLLLVDRHRPAVRIGLTVTLALIAVLLALTLYLAWAPQVDDQWFPRVYGIVAILTALGGIVVPVLSLLLPDARAVALDRHLAGRLIAEAERRGITVDELVAPVLAPADASRADAGPAA